MANKLDDIIHDLEGEHAAFAAVLEQMSPAQWDLPTHAPGWAARDQVAHLTHFDLAATRALKDPEAFGDEVRAAAASGRNVEAEYLAVGRGQAPGALLASWKAASAALIEAAKAAAPDARLPWYGPSMGAVSFLTARLMETWSHGLDVVDVVGIERPDSDRLRHVTFLGMQTRPFSYSNRGLEPPLVPVRVELQAPGGETWTFGEESESDTIRGSATDFCRVVTQRRHLADTALEVRGPAATEWMSLAQAFAGPPGKGRAPGEFAADGVR